MKRVIFLEQSHQCTSHRQDDIGKGVGTGIAQHRGGRLGLAGDDTQSRSASQGPCQSTKQQYRRKFEHFAAENVAGQQA